MPDQIIVIESYGEKSWKAYFFSDKETLGVGRSKSEAVASLYINNIGKLILENPKRFGLRIEDAGAITEEDRRKDKRTRRVDIPIAPEHWNEMCSALQNEFHVQVAQLFRNNGNKPLTPKEINKQAVGFLSRFSNGVPESINGVLRKNNLKYRLLSAYRRSRKLWDDDPLRFWIME